MNSRRVLITGATGALGPAVIRAFAADGWQICTISRHPPLAGTVAATYPHLCVDVEDRIAIANAIDESDVVVHMAALLHQSNPAPALRAEYHRVNVDGTAALLSAAQSRGVRRLVFLSSISVYGAGKEAADELTAPAPETPYAESKLQAERLVLDARSPGATPLGVVLRLAAAYGATVKGNYAQLVRALARRRFVPVGDGRNRRTIIFDEDAARAIVLAASHARAPGLVFNVTDGQVHTVDAIIQAICTALGRRPPRFAVPFRAARILVRSSEMMFRAIGRIPPVTTAVLEKYSEDVVVSGRRISEVLGFEPRWSLQEGWLKTVNGMKEAGTLE